MPNRSLRSARRPVVRSSRKLFRTTRPGVPRAKIVVWTLFQIREMLDPGSQRAAARVPAFFGWNARNRLISGGLKKGRRKKMDKRTSVRANERTKTAAKVAAAEEEKKKKKDARQSAAFVRFSARLILFAVLPVSSLFLPTIGRSRNGRIKER